MMHFAWYAHVGVSQHIFSEVYMAASVEVLLVRWVLLYAPEDVKQVPNTGTCSHSS